MNKSKVRFHGFVFVASAVAVGLGAALVTFGAASLLGFLP